MRRVLNTTVLVQLICRTPKSALDAYELYMVRSDLRLRERTEEISCRLWQRRRYPLITPGWWTSLTSCWSWQPPANFSFWLLRWDLSIKAGSVQDSFQDGNFRTVLLGGRDRNREPPTLPGEMERFSIQFLFLDDLNIYHSDWRASPRENSLFPKISGGEDVSSVYFQSTREFRRRLPPLFVVSLGRAGDKLRGRFSSSSQCSHSAFNNNYFQIVSVISFDEPVEQIGAKWIAEHVLLPVE